MKSQPKESKSVPSKAKILLRKLTSRRIVVAAILGMLALVGTLLGVQSVQSNKLRVTARKIRPGDDVKLVDDFLGGSTYGYECGWPSAGAAPTKFGTMYGGLLNDFHEQLNSLVCLSPFGTQWYNNSWSQNVKDWPVLVQYNSDQRVTAVFIDGRKATP